MMFKVNKIILYTIILVLLISSINVMAQEDENDYGDKVFRNPFIDYAEPSANNSSNNNSNSGSRNNNPPPEPIITFEDIKRELPFRLSGIITSGNKKIAIVDTGEGVEFINSSYEKNNYRITAINRDSVTVSNRGFILRLMIGGEINER